MYWLGRVDEILDLVYRGVARVCGTLAGRIIGEDSKGEAGLGVNKVREALT